MIRTRKALVIALVATALCADRALSAAPSSRDAGRETTTRETAENFVARLTAQLSERFRRTTSAVRLSRFARSTSTVVVPKLAVVHASPFVPTVLRHFQFVLPPPAV